MDFEVINAVYQILAFSLVFVIFFFIFKLLKHSVARRKKLDEINDKLEQVLKEKKKK